MNNNEKDKELFNLYLDTKKEISEPDYSKFSFYIENNNIKEINILINKHTELNTIYKNLKKERKSIFNLNSTSNNYKYNLNLNNFSFLWLMIFVLLYFYSMYENQIKKYQTIDKIYDNNFKYEDNDFDIYFNKIILEEEIILNFVNDIDELNNKIYCNQYN